MPNRSDPTKKLKLGDYVEVPYSPFFTRELAPDS